ncbi:spore germination protein [uncultured Eubacterium sp.]|uniref:spore germination protein n=1 Tax=uncultured Eubacterium sp. TaxID=165185 RepID=UPI0034A1B891
MEKNNNRKNPFLDTIDSDSSKNDGNNGVNIYPKGNTNGNNSIEYNDVNFISDNLQMNVEKIDKLLYVEQSFDLLKRELTVGNRKAVMYYINGFCDSDMIQKIEEFFCKLKADEIPDTPERFVRDKIPYVQIDLYKDQYNVVTFILSGVVCLLVEGFEKAMLIDIRKYPDRSIEEPEKYKVLRGSRDGFVENIIRNTALIRRRIRDPKYMCEVVQVGRSSRTDIAVCYMSDKADKKLLNYIKKQLREIKTDALPMNQESLSECLHKGHWFNPFPKFRYTERPDTVAAEILEGQICILVDNSPAAMLLPTTIFDVIEEADDYYFPPITGTYLRLARTIVTLVSLILTPLFLLYANNPEFVPDWLFFTKITEPQYVPIFLQLLILELAVDGLKLAAINTPSTLNTPLSLIAAIIIGEFAVNTGWFNEQTMLYMAVVAIANFTHENYELAYSIKFLRLIMLVLTQLFNLTGLIIGLVITVLTIVSNRTIARTSYIYPLYPFDLKKFLLRFFRISIKKKM